MTHCPETGKVSYESKGEALTARRKIGERLKRSHSKRKRWEQDVYHCRFCKKWHMASSVAVR